MTPNFCIMGPCGCGKSTVGILLAQQLGARFIEGDDFHPESNRQKMASGQALQDNDRKPWMALLNQALREAGRARCSLMLCTA